MIPDTEWVVANNELCERQGYVVRGLPVGEKVNFRVVAVNIAGRSPPAVMSQPVTIREIMGETDSDTSQRIYSSWIHLPFGDAFLQLIKKCRVIWPAYVYLSMLLHSALEHPKIRLPRELKTKYIKKVGEKINLTIPFQVRDMCHLTQPGAVDVMYRQYLRGLTHQK